MRREGHDHRRRHGRSEVQARSAGAARTAASLPALPHPHALPACTTHAHQQLCLAPHLRLGGHVAPPSSPAAACRPSLLPPPNPRPPNSRVNPPAAPPGAASPPWPSCRARRAPTPAPLKSSCPTQSAPSGWSRQRGCLRGGAGRALAEDLTGRMLRVQKKDSLRLLRPRSAPARAQPEAPAALIVSERT